MTITTLEEVELLIIKSAHVVGIIVVCLAVLKSHLGDLIHRGPRKRTKITKRTERHQGRFPSDDLDQR